MKNVAEENLRLEEKNAELLKEFKRLDQVVGPLKAEETAIHQLIESKKHDLEKLNEELSAARSAISSEQLAWAQEKAQQEEELRTKQIEAEKIINSHKSIEQKRVKFEAEKAEVLEREHKLDEEKRELATNAREVKDQAAANIREREKLDYDRASLTKKLVTIRDSFITEIQNVDISL